MNPKKELGTITVGMEGTVVGSVVEDPRGKLRVHGLLVVDKLRVLVKFEVLHEGVVKGHTIRMLLTHIKLHAPGVYKLGETVHSLETFTIDTPGPHIDTLKAGMKGTVTGYHDEFNLYVSFKGVAKGQSIKIPLNKIQRDEFNPNHPEFKNGDRVEVNYKGEGKWFGATCRGADQQGWPGYCAVEYDDTPGKILGTRRDNIRHDMNAAIQSPKQAVPPIQTPATTPISATATSPSHASAGSFGPGNTEAPEEFKADNQTYNDLPPGKRRRLAARPLRPLSELSGGRLIERMLREEERARRS